MEDAIIEYSLELINEEDVFSCEHDDGYLTLEGDVITNTCNGETEVLSSDVHPDKLEGGKENERFDQFSFLVDLSSTHSLGNIVLNEVFPEHIDTEVTSLLDIKRDITEAFQDFTMIPSINCTLVCSLELVGC